jgi:transposase-like protein
MLVELSVVEQRYHAVMEVVSGGVPVVEVAERYGVSRKTVHVWLRRYRQEGLPGLADGRTACITTRDSWPPIEARVRPSTNDRAPEETNVDR